MHDSADQENLTPMMRQYRENKERHPDAILLFRMGDFYEMFFGDAHKASKILDITLTSRDRNKDNSTPMCGFPHHSASAYISRLLAAGERVAVCDQMEDPRKAKGLVKRAVTRVISPGLNDEPDLMRAEENHYLVAIGIKGSEIGIASLDLTVGEFSVTSSSDITQAIQEIKRLDPREALVSERLPEEHVIRRELDGLCILRNLDERFTDVRSCEEAIVEQYETASIEGFGFTPGSAAAVAAGMLLQYLHESRSEKPVHITAPRIYQLGRFMVLDAGTLRNLEIFKNLRDGSTDCTLMGVLDETETPMGARLLRRWTRYPLLDRNEINERSETVAGLADNHTARTEIRETLKEVCDIERIVGKISLRTATPRDLCALRFSAERLPELLGAAASLPGARAACIGACDDLSYVAHAVASIIVDAPPATIRDGGVIREGYNTELDELRDIRLHGKQWIASIEERERRETGIHNLRVGYNRVFGYYIEIAKGRADKAPGHYIRKQTLVNAERYITQELKEYELKVMNAQDRILEIESEVFELVRSKLVEVVGRIQETARGVAELDALNALAHTAVKRGYVRPKVDESDTIHITAGRHPVVETFDQRETYVPNDTLLDDTQRMLIITGPNMAGKSTYMRQTALIVIMAQMGSFVPASAARIGIVDRIFTRIGAADYLAFGQSTFMVEMNETADILHNATRRSLVLLDEVGRGTSTFDGLSIAWAVTEHLHDKPAAPRTLFATHYHELTELADTKPRLRNYSIAVRESDDKIVFLRKIVPGGTARSFGIQVAKLAGIPPAVLVRAREILSRLEKDGALHGKSRSPKRRSARLPSDVNQPDLFSPAPQPESQPDELREELRKINPEAITALEALNILAALKARYT